MELSDAEMIGQSVSGDPEIFADVVRRHSDAVHAYLARRCGREPADELLGEVWLRAFRSRATYDRRSADARPWLYGIARNTLRAHWRGLVAKQGEGADPVDDPWPGVDTRLDAAQLGPALRLALLGLAPDEREVLLLVAWEHLSPGEIALCLGVPSGTVRWRLHKARKQLQDRLGHSSTNLPLTIRPKEA